MTATPPPQRVLEMFDALVELPPVDAERRLEAECAGDEKLKTAVHALLIHDRAAASDFLRSPIAERALAELTHGPLGPSAAEEPERTPLLAVASRLGRYHILHKQGEGGMGTVYVGYDEGLDRRAALKVLNRGAATRDWLLREGQALGRLAHPNVVSIYEVGEHEGLVFLAMELVEGPTLREWLAAAPRTFTEILRLFLQAGRGLAAAHRAGLIHRDFKPENVLVGKDGRARVVDFGIAALAERPVDESAAPSALDPPALDEPPNMLRSPLTRTGALIGTPAFMSPEQFDGVRATPWSDQWSFAVALYRTVFGVSPFPTTDVRALARLVRTEAPVVPPRRADVPLWLWPILATALSRSPSERFASMDELLSTIEKHVPRDPNLDPMVVVGERKVLSAFFVANMALASLLIVPEFARAILRPWVLLAIPATTFVLMAAAIALRWRRFLKNRYGRRLSALFTAGQLALLLARVVELSLGLPPREVIVLDQVVLTAYYVAIATLEHPWVGWLAAFVATGAVVATRAPDHSPAIVGAASLACLVAMVALLFAERHVKAEAAVAPDE